MNELFALRSVTFLEFSNQAKKIPNVSLVIHSVWKMQKTHLLSIVGVATFIVIICIQFGMIKIYKIIAWN